MTMISI